MLLKTKQDALVVVTAAITLMVIMVATKVVGMAGSNSSNNPDLLFNAFSQTVA